MRLQARRPFAVGDRILGGPDVLTCVPLVAQDRRALMAQARELGALMPDCIEWRADFIADLEPEEMAALLPDLARTAGRPLLVTSRHHLEGGHRPQDEVHRLAVLEAAAATGVPCMVDIELAADPALADRVVTAARAAGVRVVRSWHNFQATPPASDLMEKLRAAQASGADVAKIAVMPTEPQDVLHLLAVGLEARKTFLEIPSVLMAMGTLGGLSRLGGGYFGSDLTFAVGQQASAPGQMPLDLVERALAALSLATPLEGGGHG